MFEKSKKLNVFNFPYDDGRVPIKDALLNCKVPKPVAFERPSGKVPAQNQKMRYVQ